MIQERLLDTKRTLENLASQTGKSMEDILKCLSEGNYQFGMKNNKINDSQQNIQQNGSNRLHIDSNQRLDHSTREAKELRNCERSEQNSIGLKSDHIEFIENSTILIQESVLDLNRAITMITEDIVQQMVTKKIYKIRQSFRDQILTILGVKQLAFYVLHESGRIQYQDFSSNFITEIMQSDSKCQLLQKIVTSSEQLLYVDFADSSDLMRMFEINEVKRNQYFGVVVKKISSQNSENIAYCLMAKVQSGSIQSLKQVLNGKLISKIIEISQINTSQDSICRISKLYSKMMLDLLQILIINYDARLKMSLCSLYKIKHQLYYSLSALTKIIISKIDENLGNEQSIYLLRKLTNQFEEMQYKKIQEIRMYQKYIRENTVIMLEFNRVGVLQFMSGNRDNCYLNDLTRIWEEGKPVMDSIFGKNHKFQSYLKKAVRGALKSERPLEIADSVKTKITTNGRRIQKIYIMIQDKQQVSSLTNSMQDITLKKKDENVPNPIHLIQKENPGILKQGWLDLFIKNNTTENMEQRRQGGSMCRKNSTYISKQDNNLSYKRQLSYVPPLKQDFKINMQDISIDNPNINLLTFTDNQLECFAIKVLDSLDYFQRLPQQRKKLLNFIAQMQDNYEMHENPFHNFKHGVNVMHTAYLLSTMPANFNILTVKDIFVNVFSGLCHDVGHTGFTNAFQIASMSRKAMIYNDKSPLENFHASLTFQLLRKEENNFLCHMERDEFSKFRKAVIENILYTDIKQHFPLLNSFNDLLKSGKILGREDAPILSYMIVHASDFAGSTKQFEICKEWSRRVNMEFSNQYKMEGELGIPQTPFMKDLQNPVVLSKAQGGFLKVIVYPLYQSLNNFYITEGIAHKLKKNVEENIKCWQEMNKIETEKAKALQMQKNIQ